MEEDEYGKAIKIADRIWWVGHVLEGDPFQCHVYLIENGTESVLIDPGSKLTWEHTRKKILQLIPLENIRYIICHHQDPDIVSCIEDLLGEIGTTDRFLVTHWRAKELLEHYDWGIEFYEIQENGWTLDSGNRILEFVFTPYMHFPGAFCTYDRKSGTLFSSDIFGAITKKFSLYAEDADSYFEMMKPFHTHYMPASIIVNHGLDNIEKCRPLHLIAPQHGSIIREEFISPIMERLRTLECGLYIEFGGTKDIELMIKVNEILPRIYEEASFLDTFTQTSKKIVSILKIAFPIHRIMTLIPTDNSECEYMLLDSANDSTLKFHDVKKTVKKNYGGVLTDKKRIFRNGPKKIFGMDKKETAYFFPIFDHEGDAIGMGIFVFNGRIRKNTETVHMLKKFETAINMIAHHEMDIYMLEKEKKKVYAMAITDNLTGLHNRYYLNEIANTEIEKAKRFNYKISLLYVDLDYFKKINDTYGHETGDLVLKHFSDLLKKHKRENDMAFRLGGEEFVVIMPHTSKTNAFKFAKRIKDDLQTDCPLIDGNRICYRFSGGISDTDEDGYSITALLKSADMKLYKAKLSGRDRIVF